MHCPFWIECVLGTWGIKNLACLHPKEIGRWRDRMRRELAAGERVILRYRPEPSPAAPKKKPAADQKEPAAG